jgi:hypothetical protein
MTACFSVHSGLLKRSFEKQLEEYFKKKQTKTIGYAYE